MKCICREKVDKLKRALGRAQTTVAGLKLPNISALESAAGNAALDPALNFPVPPLAIDVPPILIPSLTAQQTATLNAAAQLSAAANLQATFKAELGVNITNCSAPKALGGIIHAARVSGLIDVLEAAANFQGLDPLAAAASAINDLYDKSGIDLLTDQIEDSISDGFDNISDGMDKGFGALNDAANKVEDAADKIPTLEDLAKLPPYELPGMIGDAVRKLNDYINTDKPDPNRKSFADNFLDNVGDNINLNPLDIDVDCHVTKTINVEQIKFIDNLLNDCKGSSQGSSQESESSESSGSSNSCKHTDKYYGPSK